ncbi:B12-binding domain-containing radical SAM protein, partial [Magnetococcales bacterium HHB-1]
MTRVFLLSPFSETKYISPINSLEYIKYSLLDSGISCELIDCAFMDREYNALIEQLKSVERPVLGITGYTRERFHAYRLIRRLRQEIPEALIVAGGRHFGFLPEETLKNLPVDIVVKGEGEEVFKILCQRHLAEQSWEDVRGIAFIKNSEVIHTPPAEIIHDLNQYRNFDAKDYAGQKDRLLFRTKVDPDNLYFPVFATRGCPSNCIFCSLTADR